MCIRTCLITSLALMLTGCGDVSVQADADPASCDLASIDRTALAAAQETGFDTIDAILFNRTALTLSHCLGHPDPAIRDELAYATLTAMLRSGKADPALLLSLRETLYNTLDAPDPDGFAHPFAALILSEVARVDRVTPYLSADDRQAMVARATTFLESETDYRGYSDSDGWRHNIAHGADWLMQLALNPALTDDDRALIYQAVGSQVQAGGGHAYIHGETERLARPYLFAAMRGTDATELWTERVTALADPSPLETWNDAFQSEADLARLHNLKAFLRILLVNVSNSDNPALQVMQPAILSTMQTLP